MTLAPLRFITFEGGEGAGKSTQIRLLREHIAALGYEVVVTREPGGSKRAEMIREFILSGGGKPFGPFAEALLFSAARIDHLREIIAPALRRGAFVLCDRFADSTRAYQGALGEIEQETLLALERVAVGPHRPGLTLILDIAPELGLARAGARREGTGAIVDRFEGEGIDFHRRLRQAFLDIAAKEPERCRVITANSAPGNAEENSIIAGRALEEVAADIWAVVQERLPKMMPPPIPEKGSNHGQS